ncbi:MAG: murein biosynthesis integral membrane protein MurJ [Simkaniaceae bacterium]|nr:murein biosynthesis integral membrane protein MurJ [Simkaniaceae bacterium]
MEKTVKLGKYFGSGLRRFFSGMMLSRISGLGRDLSMVYAFGDHPMVAAFFVAFRFANVLRRFFGEGPLQSAFIPQFEGLRSRDPEEAYAFFRKLSIIIGGLTLMIIAIGEVGIWSSLSLWSEGNQEILILTKWMLPSLFFISLYGLNVSFVQCHNRFFISSVAPLLCNVMWIAGALTLKNLPVDRAMLGLAKFVLTGFIIQWMMTAFQMLSQMGTKKWVMKDLFHPEVKMLAKAFSLGAFGVGAMQINSCLDAIFARCVHSSGPVYLWYANRFQQLALAIFGIAAVNTLVPVLSRAIKGGEIERAKGIFSFGCRRVLLIMIPMTFAICVLGFSAVNLVFGRGNFTLQAVHQTTGCLAAYASGLLPSALVMYYSAVLYAKGNFKTPAFFSVMTVCMNIALNSLFVFGFGLGPISTALATSIGAWCNFIGLRFILQKKGWTMGYRWKEFSLLAAGVLMASALTYTVGLSFSDKIYSFIIPGLTFVFFLGLYGLIFKKRLFDDRTSEANLSLVKNH